MISLCLFNFVNFYEAVLHGTGTLHVFSFLLFPVMIVILIIILWNCSCHSIVVLILCLLKKEFLVRYKYTRDWPIHWPDTRPQSNPNIQYMYSTCILPVILNEILLLLLLLLLISATVWYIILIVNRYCIVCHYQAIEYHVSCIIIVYMYM